MISEEILSDIKTARYEKVHVHKNNINCTQNSCSFELQLRARAHTPTRILLYQAALVNTFTWFVSCRSRPRRKMINAQTITVVWPHKLGMEKKCAKHSRRLIDSVPNARVVRIARRSARLVNGATRSAGKVPTQTRARTWPAPPLPPPPILPPNSLFLFFCYVIRSVFFVKKNN